MKNYVPRFKNNLIIFNNSHSIHYNQGVRLKYNLSSSMFAGPSPFSSIDKREIRRSRSRDRNPLRSITKSLIVVSIVALVFPH